ncbi:MAG: NTP transferase domain-containing protein [Verrucomicrobia bacterium]|nr:NTP transferase domain-containing protein [Verrucomicrobiota bacterium]
MAPTLLILAAGMGSRYGGLKQIDPVGPSGETVLDYAVFDALRAGFGRVVFVIRRDFEELFRAQIGARYAGRIAVDYVYQALDALPPGCTPPPGREKPWGTGHAVWCARDVIGQSNFAVINADDFYGADSFARLAAFLNTATPAPAFARGYDPMSGHKAPLPAAPAAPAPAPAEFAIVGFRMANTLSEHGAVSRGVCATDAAGRLASIVETHGITPAEVGPGKKFPDDTIVSMNCWGFTPAIFAGLDTQFREFLAARATEPKSEFYLPGSVSTMIARGETTVRVLPTDSAWFGVASRRHVPRSPRGLTRGLPALCPRLCGIAVAARVNERRFAPRRHPPAPARGYSDRLRFFTSISPSSISTTDCTMGHGGHENRTRSRTAAISSTGSFRSSSLICWSSASSRMSCGPAANCRSAARTRGVRERKFMVSPAAERAHPAAKGQPESPPASTPARALPAPAIPGGRDRPSAACVFRGPSRSF